MVCGGAASRRYPRLAIERLDSSGAGSPEDSRIAATQATKSPMTRFARSVSFIKGMTEDTRPVRSESKTLSVGRRAATAEARIIDVKGRLLAHATTTCLVFEIPKGT